MDIDTHYMSVPTTDIICRICLIQDDTLISILNDIVISSYEKLNNKLGNTDSINFNLNFGPSMICCQCLTELKATLRFLDKCEKSNQILASQNVDVSKDSKENDNECGQLDEELSCPVDAGKAVVEFVSPAVPQCPECGSRRRCDHWTPPNAFVCHHCQKVFTRKFNFKLHLKRHLGQRDWPCPTCGVLQLTKWLARNHCGPRKRRQCPVQGCNKSFTTNTNLKSHLRSHYGERPYECKECGKTFTTKNTLINHERIHTGVKPFMCPLCGRQFATNKLAAHMRVHRGEARAHVCSGAGAGCGRTFASRRSLRAHRCPRAPPAPAPAPAAARPHACALCPAAYAHRQSLKKHLRLLHAETAATN